MPASRWKLNFAVQSYEYCQANTLKKLGINIKLFKGVVTVKDVWFKKYTKHSQYIY